MPLYEYECAACGRRTEKIQKFSDPELTVCPYCNGRLERTVTAPAIQFKGAGWYKDLYSSAKPKAAGGSGESAGGTDTAKDTAAPAAKAEAPAAATSAPAVAPTPSAKD